MTTRTDAIDELRGADPAPDQAEIDRVADRVIRRLCLTDPSGVDAPRPEERGLVVDRDRGRRSRRPPALAAAVVALVVVVVVAAVVVATRSTADPGLDVAAPPPATGVDHAGRTPFPVDPATYALDPTLANSIAAQHSPVVVATVTDVGPATDLQIPPDHPDADKFPGGIGPRYVPVTIRVDDVLLGSVAVGGELRTRVALGGDVQPVAAAAGDQLLLFLSGPGPAGSLAEGIYAIGAGFFLDGDRVIDWRGDGTRPLAAVRAALASRVTAPQAPGPTDATGPGTTTTAPTIAVPTTAPTIAVPMTAVP